MMKCVVSFYNKYLIIRSLKHRIVVMLTLCTLIPIVLVGFVSYHTLFSLLNEKMELTIKSNLLHQRLILDDRFETLNKVCNQLVYLDILGNDLTMYFESTNVYDKMEILNRINSQITLMEFTNESIAKITYYYRNADNEIVKLNNSPAGSELPLTGAILGQNHGNTFYGPHRTVSSISDYPVISVMKKFSLNNLPELYVYVETNRDLVERLFSNHQFGMEAHLMLLNSEGYAQYCDNDRMIEPMSHIGSVPSLYESPMDQSRYYTFTEASKYGWQLVLLIPDYVYVNEIRAWIVRYATIAILSILSSVFVAFAIWKMVYRPVNSFNKELKRVLGSNIIEDIQKIDVQEFDEYLSQFEKMRQQIVQLILCVEKETRENDALEVQMLLYKINPHFLQNTLDTVKWYADSKKQDDIAKMISSLNKLLHYNLQKHEESTIRRELSAIHDYLLLQSIKYDLNYEECIHVPDHLLDAMIPKFILQPLIENAIFHGITGTGRIMLQIDPAEAGQILIRVTDQGIGMDQNKIDAILQMRQEASATNYGIGLNYVMRLLAHMFGGRASFDIHSKPDCGTTIVIQIPAVYGGDECAASVIG